VLLSKSLQFSGEVYLAMQSRGYHHYPRTIDPFRWRWGDVVLVIFSLTVLVGVVFIG
jgi:energy-coupling factor transporter transmembrane protein EcfT